MNIIGKRPEVLTIGYPAKRQPYLLRSSAGNVRNINTHPIIKRIPAMMNQPKRNDLFKDFESLIRVDNGPLERNRRLSAERREEIEAQANKIAKQVKRGTIAVAFLVIGYILGLTLLFLGAIFALWKYIFS